MDAEVEAQVDQLLAPLSEARRRLRCVQSAACAV